MILDKNNIMSASISIHNILELDRIIKVCEENNIDVTGSVFQKSSEEIKERKEFVERIDGDIVIKGKFNSIFGLSRKNYQKKKDDYELNFSTKKKLTL